MPEVRATVAACVPADRPAVFSHHLYYPKRRQLIPAFPSPLETLPYRVPRGCYEHIDFSISRDRSPGRTRAAAAAFPVRVVGPA
jgi:hypothetical protein